MKPTECEGQTSLFSPGASRENCVSQSPLPGSEEAVKMTAISGLKCLESSQSSGPLGLLEKMLLGSCEWRSTACYLTWQVKTTPAGRSYFRLAPSVPRTVEKESRLLPTPTASDYKRPMSEAAWKNQDGTLPCVLSGGGWRGKLNVRFLEWMMGFPARWTACDPLETP